MDASERFVAIAGLVCEPVRATMLWALLDGKAYTAGELALFADISSTSASNHLSKLLDASLLKVEVQGRHRYYSFSRDEVAYVVESLATLAGHKKSAELVAKDITPIKFCRCCYDHVAGFVGVSITGAMESKGLIERTETAYHVPELGWKWLADVGIFIDPMVKSKRPLTRQCLDWTERKPHLAGRLGAALLTHMLAEDWCRRVQFSRTLLITTKGKQALYDLLGLEL